MKYVIVSGSLREDSQSLKVSNYLSEVLKSYQQTEKVTLIDLQRDPLALWDSSFWQNDVKWEQSWGTKKEQLIESDAMILVTPEYNGIVSPSIKNFLLFVTANEVGHKPTLIVGVSASAGGSYPISELRASGYKNPRICYIPEQIIVRRAGRVLNKDSSQNDPREDAFIRGRIDFTLKVLEVYTAAFKNIRSQKNVLFNEKYANGM